MRLLFLLLGASLTPLGLPVPLPQRIEGAASGDEFLLDVNWVRNNRGRLMLMSDRLFSSRDFEAKKYLWFLRCRVDFSPTQNIIGEGATENRGSNNLHTIPIDFLGSSFIHSFVLSGLVCG